MPDRFRLAALVLLLVGFTAIPAQGQSSFFKVTVQNTGALYPYLSSGAFNTPEGATSPAPIFPGESYAFEFAAPDGAHLSLATMFVQSNDLFYAPAPTGIPLWDSAGPRTADVTAELMLWDSGTEMNQEPGAGDNQAPRQSGANTGPADGDTNVRLVNDGFTYPATADVISAMLDYLGDNRFRVTLTNASSGSTLATSAGSVAVPLAPGAYVVHGASESPLFADGQADAGSGLEALAEDGDPSAVAASFAPDTGVPTIFSPGAWVVHADGNPIFVAGGPDAGLGLEAIAEDGSPSMMVSSLAQDAAVSAGAFVVPVGAAGPGALLPGSSYEFVVLAEPGERLSFATMYVQSNDFFVATPTGGLALYDGSSPISGSITQSLGMWDAGTETDQTLGTGADQAPRQSGANTGDADADSQIRAVTSIELDGIISVAVEPLESTSLTVTIRNVSTGSTIMTSGGTMSAVPISPGAWAAHTGGMPLFAAGMTDFGLGLESIAEDGNPGTQAASLMARAGVTGGAFTTPVGAAGPAPSFPGDAYSFTFDAAPGASLSLATMFIPSNDAFLAPGEGGIALWDASGALRLGDLTSEFSIWDAGTEMNEEPAAGVNQAPTQSGANTGPADADPNVRMINDGFTYPTASQIIEVTLSLATSTGIDPGSPELPSRIRLDQNYPNPFNPETRIQFEVADAGRARLTVFDLLGREVASLLDRTISAGSHSVTWNGKGAGGQQAPTGVYVYRLATAHGSVTRTMVLLQ